MPRPNLFQMGSSGISENQLSKIQIAAWEADKMLSRVKMTSLAAVVCLGGITAPASADITFADPFGSFMRGMRQGQAGDGGIGGAANYFASAGFSCRAARVRSSWIEGIGWCNNGYSSFAFMTVLAEPFKYYAYSGVSEGVYNSWLQSSSKGRFFQQSIRGRYPLMR